MKGPKVTPYSRLLKRIDRAHMEAMARSDAPRWGLQLATMGDGVGNAVRHGPCAAAS